MKKLLVPTLLLLLLSAPQAQAGYFAFHADVIGTLSDILGDFGRPDSDEDPDCADATDGSCDLQGDDDSGSVFGGNGSWVNWILSLLKV